MNPFKKKEEKVIEPSNTTEAIALGFVQRAVKSVNGQLKIEIERNGFFKEDIIKGKLELKRTVVVSDTDSRFIAETYSIKTDKFDRMIMCVRWSPNKFVIERNSDRVANAVKVNPTFGLSKDQRNNPSLVLNATKEEVALEVRSQQYLREFEKGTKKQNSKR